MRQPASPDVAAAYFTVHNTGAADQLTAVLTGAGQEADLMTDTGTTMTNATTIEPAPLAAASTPAPTVETWISFDSAGTSGTTV